MNKTRDFKFQKLTPTENVEMNGYEQSLDFVFEPSNTDIKNIALTGIFGSGKSSVMATYEKKHLEKRFLHVSLAHFNGVEGEDDKNNYATRVEEKIINQLIQQISPDNIPDSGFRIKRSTGTGVQIGWALLVLVLIAGLWFISSWGKLHKAVTIPIAAWLTSPAITILICCVLLADIGLLLFLSIRVFVTKKKIKSISFANGSVDFEGNEDDTDRSYFDQHLDEILYLLVNSKADAIVFEDIDRFKDVDLKVLEHLRELCILANSRLTCTDKQQKVIRFFYLISDDIFLQNKERTKFFDYMLPVIPVIDASNSYNKFREYFCESGDFESFNDRFLRGLSLFVDDLRTVKNIVNEYQVYSAKLASTVSKPDCLLALIAYKNLLPEDFANLQLERGAVYKILNKKESLIIERQTNLNSELSRCEERLDAINKEHLYSVQELNIIKDSRSANQHNSTYTDYSYIDWSKNIYPKRLEALETRKKDAGKSIDSRKMTLRKELSYINNLHLAELITSENENEVFDVIKVDETIEDLREKEKNNELVKNKGFIKFLIKNGYIDETTYRDYMTFFYDNGMSLVDKEFLIGINTREGKSFDYELNNIELIMQNLVPDDFLQAECRNFGLTDYILKRGMNLQVEKFIFQLQEKRDYYYIAEYFRKTDERALFVRALCDYWTDALVEIISDDNQVMSLSELQMFVLCCLANCEIDVIAEQNIDNRITAYIENNFVDAECSINECMSVRARLAVLNVRFTDLEIQIKDKELRKVIYESNLYVLNKENIDSILRTEFLISRKNIDGYELSCIMSDNNQPLYKYASQNINDVIESIVLKHAEIFDDLTVAQSVIEDEAVEDDVKDKYLSLLVAKFTSLNNIAQEQWKRVITNNAVVHLPDVILTYFKVFGLDNELVDFINMGDTPLDYEKQKVFSEEAISIFWEECYKNSDLSDSRYREIAEQLGVKIVTFNISNITASKFQILLNNQLIIMSIQNLKFIRQYYPTMVSNYISSDPSGYVEVVSGGNLNVPEALQALENRRIDNENKKKLIALIPSTISIKGKKFDEEIVEYILDNNFDINELPYYVENFDTFNTRSKNVIFTNIKSHLNVLQNNIVIASKQKELLTRVFGDHSISFNNKVLLMDLLIDNGCVELLPNLLKEIDLDNLKKLVSGDTSRLPQIKNGANEVSILKVFEKHGIINGFEVDESGDYIRVDRKKY